MMSDPQGPLGEQRRYHDTFFWRLYDRAAQAIDRKWGWDRLPKPIGLATLVALRDTLRRKNLHDTDTLPSQNLPPLPPPDPERLVTRTLDGTYNDLENPRMGMAGARFGRNVPLSTVPLRTRQEVLEPSPREISRALMTRRELIAATSVNAIVAAWLQFMIRDWFSHGPSPKDDPWIIDLQPDDPWPARPMTVMRTMSDPTRPDAATATPPSYINTSTHWWDASQIYGTKREYQQFVRSGVDGKLRVDADGSLPMPPGEDGNPTQEPGFWIGLVVLQTLFTKEHNAVCDRLRAAYPQWTDEQIFQRARLVLAALIAKIHTTEWTPAVISLPTVVTALRANWWGLFGERITGKFGRLINSEVFSGIPGSDTDHYGVPYSLTEEFTAVYRMHPLMPDDWHLRSLADDSDLGTYTLRDLTTEVGLGLLKSVSQEDMLYSFGTLHPGVVTLHNFPRFLQEFQRPDGNLMDLAATDILRHRELGVARYCEFRRLLHLDAPATFEELTNDAAAAAEMARIYKGDIEKVDLMVGLYAERRPEGFAFSDTAFRIFVLMASRRLNSDRFFTKDYTASVYTREGLDWIADNTMATIILRHHPGLRVALRGVDNAFHAWARAEA